ncbi:hypothetical protein OIE66_40605 [Nonomuraea sp. NBC_01738]|uniref:hypothetical protein n=1 Tax=Nonomuraea sp. NBC_01738 TaxID=2976003 RepID=UPI002E0DB38A|nr:hypothetical protein OIE66_40605 [Nonomuraea sp. NBC_01738]
MDTLIILAPLAVSAAGNIVWWWLRDRERNALVRHLRAAHESAQARAEAWADRAITAEDDLSQALAAINKLQARNKMLTDLIPVGSATAGERTPRAATPR